MCDARFAVARIINQAPIATDATAPLEQEVVVAESALRSDKPMVTFGSYSVVKLVGHRGRIWGTMGVGGVHADGVGQRLIAIGRQLTRWLELTETARVWKEKAELYGPLVEEAVVAVYSIRNGRFSYVNQKFADTLGYTKEEILAFASFAEIVAEDERDRVREIVRSRQAGEHRDLRYVTRICRRNGSLIDAEVHGSVADVEGDRLVIGAAVDVTARETADKLIREREEFLRVLTDNIADVVLIDARGIVTYISGSIENVLGYTVAERQGKKAFDTIHPEDRSALAAHLNACAGSDRLDRAEYRFRHKNGSWRVLQLHGTNLLDHPHIRGWLITAADVTDRRRLEQELEQLNRLTSLGRLSAQVAHEFNNVMMGIQTPVDLIR